MSSALQFPHRTSEKCPSHSNITYSKRKCDGEGIIAVETVFIAVETLT